MAKVKSNETRENLKKNVNFGIVCLYEIYTKFRKEIDIDGLELKTIKKQKKPIIAKDIENNWMHIKTQEKLKKLDESKNVLQYAQNTFIRVRKAFITEKVNDNFGLGIFSYFSGCTVNELEKDLDESDDGNFDNVSKIDDKEQCGIHGRDNKKSNTSSNSKRAVESVMKIVMGFSKISEENLSQVGEKFPGTRNSDFKVAYTNLRKVKWLFGQSGLHFLKSDLISLLNIYKNTIIPILKFLNDKKDITNGNDIQGSGDKKQEQPKLVKVVPYRKFDPKTDKSVLSLDYPPMRKYMDSFQTLHDPEKFTDAEHKDDDLKKIFEEKTKEICKTITSPVDPESSKIYALPDCHHKIEGDMVLDDTILENSDNNKKGHIFISSGKSIQGVYDVISTEKLKKGKVAILNFASFERAGGGVASGCPAQEEDLYRRTDMSRLIWKNEKIMKNYYAVNSYQTGRLDKRKNFKGKLDGRVNDRAVFTDGVKYILNGKDGEYNEIPGDKREEFSVISIAAVNLGDLIKKDSDRKDTEKQKKYQKEMMNKIRLIILMAIANNVDTLGLGAFGCGIFGWDRQLVASFFEKILIKDKLRCYFDSIIFTMGCKSSDSTSYKDFADCLASKPYIKQGIASRLA